MYCTKCGTQIADNAKFCTSCGFKLTSQNQNNAPEENSYNNQPPGQTPIQPKKKLSKNTLILGVLCVVVIGVLVLVIGSIAETKDMRTALKNNDAATIYNTYQLAIGDEKLIGKYEDLISKKIAEITADINSYNCSEAAKTQGSEALKEYLINTFGDLFDGDYYTLEDSIYSGNEAEYIALEKLIDSQSNYYDGIYHASNADDIYDYEKAIEYFSQVQEDDSNYDASIEKITECSDEYLNLTLENVEKYIEEDDVSSAIDLLNIAKEYFDSVGLDSSEIQSKIESTLITYAKKYADKAETAFQERDINTAIGNIEIAIELQPENAEYKTKKDEYELYLPYELYNEDNILEFEENGDFWGTLSLDNTYTANDGSEMPHSIIWYNNSDDASVSMSAIYNLQGKYDVVIGQIFLPEADKSTDFEGYFVVYGDGKEIYTSPVVTSGVVPQDVSFEVSDIQTLEIAFFGQGTGGFLSTSPDFGVSNLVAQKAFPEE